MRAARITLGACGLVIVLIGVTLLIGTLRFEQLAGLGIWLACAIVLHDAVLVPAVTVLSALLKRAGRAFPRSAVLVIEGAFAVGMLISLAVGPEIYAKALGPRNSTVLPADYAARLIAVWVVIVVVASAVATVLTLITAAGTRRTNDRQLSTHA
jgi:hypothetical protein